MGILAIIATFLISILTNKTEYQRSYLPFTTIIIGILIASGYLPFQNILIMFNRPSSQSLIIVSIVIINIILNWIFIPILGINGAALGTSLSTISSVYIIKYFVRREVNIKI